MDISDLENLSVDDMASLEGLFSDALNALGDYDTSFDFETVVEDYFYILQKICDDKPQNVAIDRDYKFGITVDDTEYDLAEVITEDDSTQSSCMHEIESLIRDFGFSAEDIETALNEKINDEWE